MAAAQKYCTGCGEPLNPEDKSCAKCGEPVLSQAAETETAPETPAGGSSDAGFAATYTPVAVPVEQADRPALQETEPAKEEDPAPPRRSRYAPVSTFSFLVMYILLLIPILNIILLFVWARKNTKKVNRRSFARATLIFLLLVVAFAVVCFFFGDVLFGGIVTKYAGFLSGIGLQSIVDLWGAAA
ncbi:MAG: hypothetical protein VB092_01420 [Oscillospiraceae bacterium]|nr:hypothetical protein [Oscillospiraceae bacterium]